ncbi:MAG: CPBP family intramembrane metalloprotease [Pseudomonadota bacterium]|nr:CPBP family intramembrane metalloprotease [Pseudomonadota bacterium]
MGVGILLSLSRSVGFDPGIATLLVLLAATIMLFVIYPEKPRRIGLAGISALLGAGVLAACGWLAITDWQLSNYTSASWVEYSIFLLVQIVFAPIYEEKVVRHVLLFGLARRMGFVFSAIVVSVAFAAVHRGNFTTVLLFSLGASWLAYNGYGSLQRTLLHGANNAVIVLWQLGVPHWLQS